MDYNMLGDLEIPYPNRRRTSSTRQRPKVKDEDRKRIAMACDHCRSRKIKCTGKQPCRQCIAAKVQCTYPPSSAKVVVSELYIETLQKHISALDKCLRESVPDPLAREEILNHHGLKFQPIRTSNTAKLNSMPISPRSAYGSNAAGTSGSRSPATSQGDFDFEDESLDLEGYTNHLGDSTITCFLGQIAELLKEIAPSSPDLQEEAKRFGPSLNSQMESLRYLSNFANSCDNLRSSISISESCTLPPKSTFLTYFETFLTYSGPGTSSHPAISGGIYYWFSPLKTIQEIESLYKISEVYGKSLPNEPTMVDCTLLSTINMAIALGSQAVSANDGWLVDRETDVNTISPRMGSYMAASGAQSPVSQAYSPQIERANARYTPTTPPHNISSLNFFTKAKHLLVNPVDDGTRSYMRVFALMAFYLSACHRETGYMYIGLAVRIAVAQGLHRASKDTVTVDEGVLQEIEERKREFWNVYILDRLYSCIMGRPMMVSDEDIDVDLPSEKAIGTLPSGTGLAAHARLSKIMGDIASKIYRVRKPGAGRRRENLDVVQVTERIQSELDAWKENLKPELRVVNGVARCRTVLLLHMLHNQLYILTARPSLLLAIKKRMAGSSLPFGDQRSIANSRIETQANICISSARRNITLTRQMDTTQWISAQCFTDYHYTFSAIVTLLLSQLLSAPLNYGSNTFSNDSENIDFGISYLSGLRRRGNESAGVCANILVELSSIIQKILLVQMRAASPVSLSDSNPLVEIAEATSVTMNPLNCFHYPNFGEQQLSIFNGQFEADNTAADLYGQRTLMEMQSWLQTSGPFDR